MGTRTQASRPPQKRAWSPAWPQGEAIGCANPVAKREHGLVPRNPPILSGNGLAICVKLVATRLGDRGMSTPMVLKQYSREDLEISSSKLCFGA